MTGGISSVVHRLTIDRSGRRESLVLRQYEHPTAHAIALIEHELTTLPVVRSEGLPAPEPIAADASGLETDNRPTILMTRLPGRLDLAPADPERWLRQMAAMAARIHELPVPARPFWSREDAANPAIPASATRPAVWKRAFDLLRQPAPEYVARFLHRDFQHFNLLWQRGRLTGVVDWVVSCAGPADFDLGHCRLNLAVLFSADHAERLRLAYEAESGRTVDPWWDLYAITAYCDDWQRFIPVQVSGRTAVDTAGMTSRVENLLEATLRRL